MAFHVMINNTMDSCLTCNNNIIVSLYRYYVDKIFYCIIILYRDIMLIYIIVILYLCSYLFLALSQRQGREDQY